MENKFLITGLLIGVIGTVLVYEVFNTGFDCVEDYKGQVVVEIKGNGDYIISSGYDYSTVSFPAICQYSLGDTIGRAPVGLELLRDEVENLTEIKRGLERNVFDLRREEIILFDKLEQTVKNSKKEN